MTLMVEHVGSREERMGFSRGRAGVGAWHAGPPGPRVGRGGHRGACNYLSMATGRWGRPLGNPVGTTWKKVQE